MTIIEYLKDWKTYKRHSGLYGIEIETETKTPYNIPPMKFWDSKGDGSLRDFGVEYILKVPLSKNELDIALREFEDKTKGIKFVEDSISTSVHVHINFLNETFKTLGNFLTTYVLVENVLMRYAGSDRLSNLFCLPICDAEENFHVIMDMCNFLAQRKYGSAFQINNDAVKYAGLNLAALPRFGSIEIRTMRGVTDNKTIKEWIGILDSIVEFSRGKIAPGDIVKGYEKIGANILKDIFRNYYNVIQHPDQEQLLLKNLHYAVRIAAAVDWDCIDTPPDSLKKKMVNLNKLANEIYKQNYEALSAMQQRHVLIRHEELRGNKKPSSAKKAASLNNLFIPQPVAHQPAVGDIMNQANVGWINEAPDADDLNVDDVEDHF